MATHAHTTGCLTVRHLELVNLDHHPDGALLRLCAGLERLRTITEGLELVAASLIPRTMLGRRMKEMTL